MTRRSGVTSSNLRSAITSYLQSPIECACGSFELVAAARVAEADNLALVERQAVAADRLARPGTDVVDAVLEAEPVGHVPLGVLRQLLGLGDCLVDATDHVERGFRQVIILAVNDRLERTDRVFDLHPLGRA